MCTTSSGREGLYHLRKGRPSLANLPCVLAWPTWTSPRPLHGVCLASHGAVDCSSHFLGTHPRHPHHNVQGPLSCPGLHWPP